MPSYYSVHIKCPFCRKGEIRISNRAKIEVSTVCPICQNLFYANLYTIKAFRPKDYGTKTKPFPIRLPCPCIECNGELRSDGKADVQLSLRCAKKNCRQFFIADLRSLTTCKSVAIKEHGNKTIVTSLTGRRDTI